MINVNVSIPRKQLSLHLLVFTVELILYSIESRDVKYGFWDGFWLLHMYSKTEQR